MGRGYAFICAAHPPTSLRTRLMQLRCHWVQLTTQGLAETSVSQGHYFSQDRKDCQCSPSLLWLVVYHVSLPGFGGILKRARFALTVPEQSKKPFPNSSCSEIPDSDVLWYVNATGSKECPSQLAEFKGSVQPKPKLRKFRTKSRTHWYQR